MADWNKTFALGGDLVVNRLGYGTMRLVPEGVWGAPIDRAEATKVLRRAVELGVNLLDTADAYGPQEVERLIGEALAPYPPGVVIATKSGFVRMGPGVGEALGRPTYLRQQVEMSLRYLKLERIELWQLHRIDPLVPVEESLGEIAKLQAEGKIRHVGLSEVGVEQIKQARKVVPIVSVQNKYNLSERKYEAVLEHCEAEGIGFIPWRPVAAGNLTAPGGTLDTIAKARGYTVSQVMLAWLLRRSPVMLPIPGTSSVKHLEQNVAAGEVRLTAEEWAEVEAAV